MYLDDAEIVTQIQVPASPLAARSAYMKFKERSSLDFAMVAAAAAVDLARTERCGRRRLVLGAVARFPGAFRKRRPFWSASRSAMTQFAPLRNRP